MDGKIVIEGNVKRRDDFTRLDCAIEFVIVAENLGLSDSFRGDSKLIDGLSQAVATQALKSVRTETLGRETEELIARRVRPWEVNLDLVVTVIHHVGNVPLP